jgi:pre-mRNA processing factor 4 (PRP4) like
MAATTTRTRGTAAKGMVVDDDHGGNSGTFGSRREGLIGLRAGLTRAVDTSTDLISTQHSADRATKTRTNNHHRPVIMDLLKAEVDKKRKALDTQPDAAPAHKYVRRADVEREREAAYWAQQQERKVKAASRPASQKLMEGATLVAAAEDAQDKGLPRPDGKEEPTARPEVFNISSDEAVRRLRAKGQPIRLFAESDKERRLRLRALELIEERTEGQRNDFMRALETMDKGLDLEELARKANPASRIKAGGSGVTTTSREGSTPLSGGDETEEVEIVDLKLLKTDPKKLYPQIYFGIKVRALCSHAFRHCRLRREGLGW